MRHQYSMFLISFIILSLSYIGVSGNQSDVVEQNQSYPTLMPLQVSEPLENDSKPIITTNKTLVEWGNDVTIFHGMIDNKQYISGYNFSIYLAQGVQEYLRNETSILGNYSLVDQGITQNTKSEFSFNSLTDATLIDLHPSQYTLYLLINSTNRGLLNATTFFEIISNPGANIAVTFLSASGGLVQNNEIELKINSPKQLSIILINTGKNNAFTITLKLGSINEPIGLTNTALPAEIAVLAPSEEIGFNFTVRPEAFGIGKIFLELRYFDGAGADKTSFHEFKVKTFPTFIVNFEGISDVMQYDETEGLDIIIFIQYSDSFSLAPISVSLKLISLSMTFLPNEKIYSNLTSVYIFKANPVEFGIVKIDLWISIVDPIGDDVDSSLRLSKSFELVLLRAEQKKSISDYFPIIAVAMYLILITTLVILYYRKDIRTKFFTQVLGLHILENINYKTTSIIIDGSNIAWEQINSSHKPMINNIIRAYKALKENNFQKIVIIADAALRYQVDDRDELDRLVKSGFIKLVPAKVNADGFILRFSAENGYLILTNDLFKEYRDTYSWIDERRVPYTIFEENFYLHPTFE